MRNTDEKMCLMVFSASNCFKNDIMGIINEPVARSHVSKSNNCSETLFRIDQRPGTYANDFKNVNYYKQMRHRQQ